MSRLANWFDDRTGYRAFVHEALYERIPGGARWRYVWGSTLAFAFFVQVVTGLILWSAYSPSAQTAWESVYFIQYRMTGGWLLRGVHHYMAQAMVVLLAIHFVQVVVDGAYRAPREINFWIGLALLKLVLALALTGYLLPWDEKGYWATKVATNMVALVPLVGPAIQRLLVGGTEYGHHTLTRFFALHAGVLPGLLTLFLVLHVALFRRHGIKAREPYRKLETTFWPEQVLRDAVACLAVTLVVMLLVLQHYPTARAEEPLAGQLGAELTAPADPADNYSAARPETYFLFLFQTLKYLENFPPIAGAIAVPALVMLSLVLMPIVGRWELGHRFNVVWTFTLLIGACVLTALALHDDYNGKTDESRHFLTAVADANAKAERAVELAGSPTGIPPTGELGMLRADPKTQGPKLFRQNCAACHSHAAPTGTKHQSLDDIVATKPTASNLEGFGTPDWIKGILDPEKIAGPDYFGNTSHKDGDMVDFVREHIGEAGKKLHGDELKSFQHKVESVAIALASESGVSRNRLPGDPDRIAAGRKAIVNDFKCVECHKFHEDGMLGNAPDLTGYASHDWLTAFISNPSHERFYGDNNDRMPAFAAQADNPAANRLSPEELRMLVDWLRGDWYRPGETPNTSAH
ncbi:MAG TPA: cytochrome b N-terminal domain-containing protein [Lacipirellulaceae bacterium]|jgi:ubiquinol-cytochrome c reductase cytochrome b subunit